MFALTDIEQRYGTAVVLQIDAWRADAGEHWLVAGASGSGKTTLLNLLAGLATPTAGTVRIGDVEPARLSPSARDRWRGRQVGFVPQRLHLVAALDVLDNLRLARYLAGLPADAARARALLAALNLEALARRFPSQLSQGQAQRVAVARAVINHPQLLLAYEPTANLDDEHAAAALALLRDQAEATGATLVVASHDARVRSLLPHVRALPARPGPAP